MPDPTIVCEHRIEEPGQLALSQDSTARIGDGRAGTLQVRASLDEVNGNVVKAVLVHAFRRGLTDVIPSCRDSDRVHVYANWCRRVSSEEACIMQDGVMEASVSRHPVLDWAEVARYATVEDVAFSGLNVRLRCPAFQLSCRWIEAENGVTAAPRTLVLGHVPISLEALPCLKEPRHCRPEGIVILEVSRASEGIPVRLEHLADSGR